MLKELSTDEACKILFDLDVCIPCRIEEVLLDQALHRVIAMTIVAQTDVPPFDRSPFDGFAFRGEDTVGATSENPAVLKVIEEIPAGKLPLHKITPGYAAKILTGAPIPEGANATIKYELTSFSDDTVNIFKKIRPNTDIVRAGTDVKPGKALTYPGQLITAPVISSLANQGCPRVDVFCKPRISVISTGSELCEVGEPLRPAAIYNSNVHTISAYLNDVGVEAINRGSVPDDPDEIAQEVSLALLQTDMVITTGGASVGDYDWAVTAMEKLDARILFWKASLRPGGAILVAEKAGKVVISLSGNPAAAVIGLLRIGMPYIKKLCRRVDCFYPEISVALRRPLKKSSPKMRILRGTLEIEDGKAYFAEAGNQGSETTSSLVGCDLLGEIPMGSPPLPAGTIIKAYRI